MDKKHTGELLNAIKTVFHNFAKDNENPKLMFELWHDCLKDCDYDRVVENFKEYCKYNRFPPTISDLYVNESKYPAHASAKEIIAEIEKHREAAKNVTPPKINIREYLEGKGRE